MKSMQISSLRSLPKKLARLRIDQKSYLIFFILAYFLSIGQDYLFTVARKTSFYLSESSTYNIIWLLFIPIVGLITKRLKKPTNNLTKALLSLTISAIHLFVFTLIFCGLSRLFFTPSHDFSRILNSAMGKFYLLFSLIYFISLYTIHARKLTIEEFPQNIKVKHGGNFLQISVEEITLIRTERPYLSIHTKTSRYLHPGTIKGMQECLDPAIFIRVHKSTILNSSQIMSMKSRKNGDYDVEMIDGKIIRMSRHYRSKWQHLLD